MNARLRHGITLAATLAAAAAPALTALAGDRICALRYTRSAAQAHCRLTVARATDRDKCKIEVACANVGNDGLVEWAVQKLELPLQELRELKRCQDGTVATSCTKDG